MVHAHSESASNESKVVSKILCSESSFRKRFGNVSESDIQKSTCACVLSILGFISESKLPQSEEDARTAGLTHVCMLICMYACVCVLCMYVCMHIYIE